METIKIGEYRHYKGKHYELLFIATHSETIEKMAVYKQLYGEFEVWVRPLNMFLEHVVVEGIEKRRFEPL